MGLMRSTECLSTACAHIELNHCIIIQHIYELISICFAQNVEALVARKVGVVAVISKKWVLRANTKVDCQVRVVKTVGCKSERAIWIIFN